VLALDCVDLSFTFVALERSGQGEPEDRSERTMKVRERGPQGSTQRWLFQRDSPGHG